MFELPMTMTFFLLRPSVPLPLCQSQQRFQHGLFNCFVFGFCVVALCLTWPGPALPGLALPGPMVVRLSHCRFLHNKTTKLTVKCWSASTLLPSTLPTVLCAVLPGKYLIWSKGFSSLSFSFVFFLCFFFLCCLSRHFYD